MSLFGFYLDMPGSLSSYTHMYIPHTHITHTHTRERERERDSYMHPDTHTDRHIHTYIHTNIHTDPHIHTCLKICSGRAEPGQIRLSKGWDGLAKTNFPKTFSLSSLSLSPQPPPMTLTMG